MEESISVLQQIVPDIMSVLQNRYHIMRNIQMYAPVGRRVLADKVSLSERTLRTETDFLRKQGLLSSSKNGMELTEEGENVFRHLEKFMRLLLNMNAKEKALADYLNIQFCRIVPGDSDEDASILDEIGKTAAKELHVVPPRPRAARHRSQCRRSENSFGSHWGSMSHVTAGSIKRPPSGRARMRPSKRR